MSKFQDRFDDPRKMSRGRQLSNPKIMERFVSWMQENCVEPDGLRMIDVNTEFGKDLSYSEAIELAFQKFPTLWRSVSKARNQQQNNKPKQIIFVSELVQKIIDGTVQVTYRKSPKVGMYYVIENRFTQKSDSAKLLIEFYRTDRVDAYDLSDEEAQLAGVETADKIRLLFEKWYGSPIPTLYRNWFKITAS
ncbi:MAG: hypothetical protein ACREBS_11035 [Nitrososphaerales archaeon]